MRWELMRSFPKIKWENLSTRLTVFYENKVDKLKQQLTDTAGGRAGSAPSPGGNDHNRDRLLFFELEFDLTVGKIWTLLQKKSNASADNRR